MSFINISNHPSARWEAAQLKAACIIGGSVVDYPFPPVNPQATTSDVDTHMRNFIMGIPIAHDDVVHIMGEMGFVFAFVKEMQRRGIRCVQSTTERVSVENEDGTKTTKFNFVQFRDYSTY